MKKLNSFTQAIEYCCSLFLKASSILSKKRESVQSRAIRAIYNAPRKFSVTDGRRLLNLHTLCSRWFYFFRNLVHKVQCGLASSELYQLIENISSHQMNLRSSCRHILPSVNTNNGKRRFSFCAVLDLQADKQIACHLTPSAHWIAIL